jgi:hypothetical protein
MIDGACGGARYTPHTRPVGHLLLMLILLRNGTSQPFHCAVAFQFLLHDMLHVSRLWSTSGLRKSDGVFYTSVNYSVNV